MVYGLFLGDISLDALLAAIETDLAACGADISVVGPGHFTWPVDDTSHDGYLEIGEAGGRLLDAGDGAFEVVERTSAARTRDILNMRSPQASSLQYGVGRSCDIVGRYVIVVDMEIEAVTKSVKEHCAAVETALYLEILKLVSGELVGEEERDGVGKMVVNHTMHKRPELSDMIGMGALRNDDYFGVALQAFYSSIVEHIAGEEEELDRRIVDVDL